MTPFDDFVYLINHVLLGEEPTIEDFILLVGTLVAFIAFILWCCFPIQPKNHIKAFDAATSTDNDNAATSATATATNNNSSGNNTTTASGNNNTNTSSSSNNNFANGVGNNLSNNSQYNGSYSKNGTIAMHNYYVKNGHHCCT